MGMIASPGLLTKQPSASAYVCRACLGRLSAVSKRQYSTVRAFSYSESQSSTRSQVRPQYRAFSSSSHHSAKQAATGKVLLPEGPARTRFAPSPTGYLHLGSLRTALFNYLLAKKTGGQFLLRIEDTDQKRLVPDAEQRLCDDLRWAGIQWDEGPQVGGPYGSYKQSERTPLYQEHAHKLLDSHSAYRCFCSSTPPPVAQTDVSQIGAAVGGCQSDCASIPDDQSAERAHKGDRHVVRMRKPAKSPSWTDLVYGKSSLDKSSKNKLPQNLGVDGVVLLKGDGTPTYHLANVVDDHHMKITHVIRGSEWMASTPLHMALYSAFDWTPPAFAHVGLLTDKDQAKLSKRNFDTDIGSLRQKHGILPETLVNFLALLGWRNPTRDDVMELQDLVRTFDLKFTKGNTIVSFDKLWYLQKNHAKIIVERAMQSNEHDSSFENLVDFVVGAAKNSYQPNQYQAILGSRDLRGYVMTVLSVDDKNYENPADYVERNKYFFTSELSAAESVEGAISSLELYKAVSEMMKSDNLPATQSSTTIAGSSYETLKAGQDDATSKYASAIEAACLKQASGEDEEAKALLKEWRKSIHRYLREKLLFGLPGPGNSQVMAVLGYEECCRRLGVN